MVTTLWMCFLPLLTLVVVTRRNQVKMKVRCNQITQPHIIHFSFPPFPPLPRFPSRRPNQPKTRFPNPPDKTYAPFPRYSYHPSSAAVGRGGRRMLFTTPALRDTIPVEMCVCTYRRYANAVLVLFDRCGAQRDNR